MHSKINCAECTKPLEAKLLKTKQAKTLVLTFRDGTKKTLFFHPNCFKTNAQLAQDKLKSLVVGADYVTKDNRIVTYSHPADDSMAAVCKDKYGTKFKISPLDLKRRARQYGQFY